MFLLSQGVPSYEIMNRYFVGHMSFSYTAHNLPLYPAIDDKALSKNLQFLWVSSWNTDLLQGKFTLRHFCFRVMKKNMSMLLENLMVRIKLSLCLTKHHAMKTYWGVEKKSYKLLSSSSSSLSFPSISTPHIFQEFISNHYTILWRAIHMFLFFSAFTSRPTSWLASDRVPVSLYGFDQWMWSHQLRPETDMSHSIPRLFWFSWTFS
jgi:hypothetical protein